MAKSLQPPSYNPIKDNFHAIVQQKKASGMPGHQAIAETYAQAFPGQTVYHPTPATPSSPKIPSLYPGVRVKKPRNLKP